MKLSVCIPTYNRLPYLRELIGYLAPQMAASGPEDVELVVSDNSSTDGTAAYLASLEVPQLRFWTNESNIGGDRNFLKCVREAKGEYVWLVGDDDIVPYNALGAVLESLKTQCPGLIVSSDGEACRPKRSFNGYKEFLEKSSRQKVLSHTLISANVFKRSLFDFRLAERMLWTQYSHMIGILSGLDDGLVIESEPFIKVRDRRPEFAEYPDCLCVKQAVYLAFLARRFSVPRYYLSAVVNALNLPLEFASRLLSLVRKHR